MVCFMPNLPVFLFLHTNYKSDVNVCNFTLGSDCPAPPSPLCVPKVSLLSLDSDRY